ncbi:protein adenylyltransferase SelO family protein [Granulosicoccus sp.]|nr:protein adenylyltransferase SelO family protein [Granulosicoccus sp.]
MNLAQCLLPFIHEDKEQSVSLAQESINRFDSAFVDHYLQRMRAKLGLADEQDDDLELASRLLELMEAEQLDFTISFTQLTQADATSLFAPGGALHDWHLRWQQRLDNEPEQMERSRQRMQQVNPIVIPRNHLIEAFIDQAIREDDYSGFHTMLEAVTSPFDIKHLDSVYATAPASGEVVTQTFCGT